MPADINIWVLAIAGMGAGFLGSMLGVGGGFLIVPVLTLTFNIPIQYAIGASLTAIVINACTSTSIYIQKHMANLKLGLLLSTTLVPGAAVGAFLATILSGTVLITIFSILLLYIVCTMIPKKQRNPTPATIPFEELHLSAGTWLNDSYYDPAVREEISYTVKRPLIGLTTGFFGGVVSSLLGIGGGVINVPVMNKVMKVPIKATVATSSLLLCFTTMTGSLIYALNGFVLPYVIAPLCIGVFLGARLGTLTANRIHSSIIMTIFSILLMLTSLLMLLRAFGIPGDTT